jgi:hypothetical protein
MRQIDTHATRFGFEKTTTNLGWVNLLFMNRSATRAGAPDEQGRPEQQPFVRHSTGADQRLQESRATLAMAASNVRLRHI